MGVLSDSPQGLSNAVTTFNRLPKGVLLEMCQDVIAFLLYDASFINTVNYELDMAALDTQASAQTCIEALTFIFRNAAVQKLSPDALVAELKSSMEWSDGVLAIVQHVWKEEGQALCDKPKDVLSVGQLVSMDWKLGVSISSSSCRSLNSPHVSLLLKVANPAGTVQQHSAEMSVSEFQNFAAQLKEMANTLDTMS
ncbi:hypothetical protein EMCRGX_G033511 [Ephydatia muelleri]|eukprot:Em0022g732a